MVLHGVTWCYTVNMVLQVVLQGVTGSDKVLHCVTLWYMELHGVHGVTRCYMNLDGVT